MFHFVCYLRISKVCNIDSIDHNFEMYTCNIEVLMGSKIYTDYKSMIFRFRNLTEEMIQSFLELQETKHIHFYILHIFCIL